MVENTSDKYVRRNIVILPETYEWLNSQRKTVKGPYTPAKKESFDSVLKRIRQQAEGKKD